MSRITRKNPQQGQVMLTIVLLFLAASVIIVLGVATPILRQVRISLDMMNSKQSYYLANGTLEDAMIRLQANKTVSTGDSVTLNGYTATVSVTSTSNGKTIDVTGNEGNLIRKMEASVVIGTGASFNYGVQAGNGGFNISGGSTVNGNVYANGSILGSSGTITGSAIAANSSALTSDQSNSGATPITTCTTSTCITFRNASASRDFAQSFQVSTSSPINKISLYVKKTGSPADATVRLVADSSGAPGTTDLLSSDGTLSASQVSASTFGWVDVVFPSNPVLTPGTTYWFVINNGTQSSSNYYQIGATTGGYANGTADVGKYSGTWTTTTPSGLDSYFNIYLGGVNATIGGGSYAGALVIGQNGVGDAWAHTVQGTTVAGTIYCQTGTTNNKTCTTTRTDPTSTGFPISDANIQEWKNEASAGWTYNGDVTIGSTGTTTGPMVITGNLTVNGGGTFKMTGTVWVKGNVIFSNGAKFTLDSSYGSSNGVLISDGTMSLSGAATFSGSGQTGSYPFLITTSSCPNGTGCGGSSAISLSGGAGAVVLIAQNGTLTMNGGGAAKALTANEIDISGGGSVTYDSGLVNANFTSGPSGGWNITTWKEVQ